MNKPYGIPTMYRGRRYRSRLEARWAAFFTLMDWRFEYEPYDLPGWIPDFVLYGDAEILVEVKPYSSLQEYDTDKIERAIRGSYKDGREVLLLGSSILDADCWKVDRNRNAASIGWLGEYWPESGSYDFDTAVMNHYLQKYGFFHNNGSWKDRMTGLHDGDHYLDLLSLWEAEQLWNLAGNSVQWKVREAA